MNFWHSFLSLCNANRTSPNRVAKELSIGSATVTGWKNGAMPSDKNMMKIADYFQVDWELLKAGNIVAEDALLTTPCIDEKETPIFPDSPEGWEYLDDIDRKMVTDFINRLLQADKYRRGEKEGGC